MDGVGGKVVDYRTAAFRWLSYLRYYSILFIVRVNYYFFGLDVFYSELSHFDFSAFMHEAHLQPPELVSEVRLLHQFDNFLAVRVRTNVRFQVAPLNARAFASLNAMTKFWPFVLSDTIIFSLIQV